MSVFTGSPLRPGVALAAAARLRVEYGVASFAPERLRRIAQRLRAFGVESPEPEQVILIVDTIPPGFTAAVTGLEVVGIAVGSDSPPAPAPDCPVVSGLGAEFFESVSEDEIVIVDGSRGRVYVSPDAAVIARYQAPTTRNRRIFLESAHLPARTASDSRIVSVFAGAASAGDVSRAVEAGADGVFLVGRDTLLGGDVNPTTASEQKVALRTTLETVAGLPLLLGMPSEQVSLTAVAEASAEGPIHLLVDDADTHADLQARLAEIEAAYAEEDVPFGTPQFELSVSIADPEAPLPEGLEGFIGIIASESLADAQMERLMLVAGLALRTHKPLLLSLGSDWEAELPTALSLGVRRILAPVTAIPAVKDAVRAW